MLPKKLNFNDTRLKISGPLAMSTNLRKKSSKLSKKNRKKSLLGRSWSKIGLRKAQPNDVRRDEIPSPSIDKTNGCAMKSERGALVRDSDPPSGQSVHKMAGYTWRALARRLIQTHLAV